MTDGQTDADDDRPALERDGIDELDVQAVREAAEGAAAVRCRTCGANAAWDPDADALSCEYCGTVTPVPRREGTILERPLSEAGTAARGLGLEMRVLDCKECGARVALQESETAATCVYCGSAQVLSQDANRNALRPESLLPLTISADEVRQAFLTWIRGLWFRPNALKQVDRFDAVGVYAPFWTFDADVHSEWSADAGYYYYVTVTKRVMVNGKWQTRRVQERRTRWEPAWGERDDAYDDLLICASKGLAGDLVDRLGGFDTAALVPYQPQYLAGWRAEEYQVDLEAAWAEGGERIERQQHARCGGDVPGDTHRFLRVHNTISGVHWKHVLLPVWSLSYRFGDRTWTVLVNGQTGRIVGKAPLSWVKILLAVASVGAIAGVVALAKG